MSAQDISGNAPVVLACVLPREPLPEQAEAFLRFSPRIALRARAPWAVFLDLRGIHAPHLELKLAVTLERLGLAGAGPLTGRGPQPSSALIAAAGSPALTPESAASIDWLLDPFGSKTHSQKPGAGSSSSLRSASARMRILRGSRFRHSVPALGAREWSWLAGSPKAARELRPSSGPCLFHPKGSRRARPLTLTSRFRQPTKTSCSSPGACSIGSASGSRRAPCGPRHSRSRSNLRTPRSLPGLRSRTST
jgi:hypothetical protein